MPESRIEVGVIGRAHGVRGLVKVTSHTADPSDLTAYGPLSDAAGRLYRLRWKGDGIAEVCCLANGQETRIADRTAAEKLTNTRLFIDRSALPPAEEDEFYVSDLVGLRAVGADGADLGVVETVHDYGAGASLEIPRAGGASLIVPFTAACVPTVDIAGGKVVLVPPHEMVVTTEDAAAPREPVVTMSREPVVTMPREPVVTMPREPVVTTSRESVVTMSRESVVTTEGAA